MQYALVSKKEQLLLFLRPKHYAFAWYILCNNFNIYLPTFAEAAFNLVHCTQEYNKHLLYTVSINKNLLIAYFPASD